MPQSRRKPMSQLKLKSRILELARQRLAGLKAFEHKAQFGPNLTEAIYEEKINSVATQIDAYRQLLAELDQKLNNIEREEFELNHLNIRFLGMCAAQFGSDSQEYQMLGGIGPMERRRRREVARSSRGS